ncbi:Na/Pi symporter [Pontibacter sp. G13]|uniref:Na/Pi symporter n=1 Tax=Pontibacter sp. G13 TaxID=3074898 RepID=UPI00288A236A|nr:Na/Pi symporter [Pontibacter sp. G13]WNJ19998.1 Na/Pi symporter [Pontibacter sp. G13]
MANTSPNTSESSSEKAVNQSQKLDLEQGLNASQLAGQIGLLLIVLFAFLVSLNVMSGSFKLFGKGLAEELFNITSNPFISLFIGMLATAIIQSSSTATTIIVGLVGAGQLSVAAAAPMIMGANIGTSVTSTIVAMGHITNREEYKKAVAGACVHDFFNIITVIILFTVETTTHMLSDAAIYLAGNFEPVSGEKSAGVLWFVKSSAKWVIALTGKNGVISLIIGLLGLFFSLQFLSKVLKTLVIGKIENNMNRYVFQRPPVSLLVGFLSTTAVQSSSITSSLMVPLVATNKVTLRNAFPFLMGANIGTTTTALFAALFAYDSSNPVVGAAQAGLAIAFVHLLFNLFGVLVLFPIPKVREIPIRLAEGLGQLTLKNRLYGIAYVVVTFFLIPGLLIFLTKS